MWWLKVFAGLLDDEEVERLESCVANDTLDYSEVDKMRWLLGAAVLLAMAAVKSAEGTRRVARRRAAAASRDFDDMPPLGVSPPVPGYSLGNRESHQYLNRRSDTHLHRGVDIFAPAGSPVVAPVAGTVVIAEHKWSLGFSGYGKVVVLEVDDGVQLLFAHLERVTVIQGVRLLAGGQVGTVGSTAYARRDRSAVFKTSGPHLHFEASRGSYPMGSEAERIDPRPYLGEG